MSDKKIIDTENLENYKDIIKNFKPPKRGKYKIPYVLFGAWKVVYRPSGETSYKADIEYRPHTLTFEHGEASEDQLFKYINKKYKILDYFFPKIQDIPAEQAPTESGFIQYVRSSHKNGELPYSKIEKLCQREKLNAQNENEALTARKELDEANEKVSSLLVELERSRAKEAANKKVKNGKKENTSSDM